jgi:hypothetical protein
VFSDEKPFCIEQVGSFVCLFTPEFFVYKLVLTQKEDILNSVLFF